MQMNYRICAVSLTAASVVLSTATAWADDREQSRHHQVDVGLQEHPCVSVSADASASDRFDGVQVETSDIALFEQFFGSVLKAPLVQHADHPQADRLRGYCYRGVLVVVRQDLRTTRPTGWVQLNFSVPDVASVREEIERVYRTSPVAQLAEAEQSKIVRFRFKSSVMRGNRHVMRLEVAGPEGFMIGFDQSQPSSSEGSVQSNQGRTR
jgi:hypothetical protein